MWNETTFVNDGLYATRISYHRCVCPLISWVLGMTGRNEGGEDEAHLKEIGASRGVTNLLCGA